VSDSPGSPLRGNASTIARDYRGWFLGHFMPGESPLHSTDVEVKWTIHTQGETRPQWSPPSSVRTLNLLVRGKFTVLFPEEEVTMQKEGDFVLFGPGVAHSFRCDEESLVLTIRWPSRPG
jgi:quercetin dioxygenase-like cupin family protein